MIEKLTEIFDGLPDIAKAIIFVSIISIFWSIIL